VYTAAVVLFNHCVTYQRDLVHINDYLYNAIMKIMEVIGSITDKDAVVALMLAESRMIYKNQYLLSNIVEIKDKFVKVHREIKIDDPQVKNSIQDVISLVGE